jgi:YbbR domain-containing protein
LKDKAKSTGKKTQSKKDMNNDSFRIFTAMNKKANRKYSPLKDRNGDEWKERRKDHLVFVICLILAATFWFLIKLSDVYAVSYNLKVKYTHVPMGHLITSLQDSTVTIHFKSNGYNLLDLLIHRQLDTLSVNLDECNLRKISDKTYVVTTASLREPVAQKLGINDQDLDFSKPQLTFYMEKLSSKKMPIQARLDLTFKSQYNLYKYEITPLMVRVFGPKKVLDTLQNLYTQVIRKEKAQGKIKTEIPVANPLPRMLKFYPPVVTVTLDVEKYTERSVTVPVDVSGIHPVIRTFPLNVTVNFNVFIRDYEKIHPGQFRIVPNVKNIDLNTVKKLRLEVISAPKNVSNVRVVPPEVEFIIVK